MSLAYATAYNGTTGNFDVNQVTVSGIAGACVGQNLTVTLANSSLAALGSGSTTVTGGSATVTITPAAPAQNVAHAAVLIAN